MKTIEQDITEFRDFLQSSINDSDRELLMKYKDSTYEELGDVYRYSKVLDRIYTIRVLTNILELQDVEKKF